MHGVEQGGSWCSHRGWLMPYGVMYTAKGLTARCSLWGWMSLRRATARVWERPSLIDTGSAREAASPRQSVMIPVILRLWVASDTLVGGRLCGGSCGRRGGCGPCVLRRAGAGPPSRECVCLCVWASCWGGLPCGRGGPGRSVMEGGVWEVLPCYPCVQGGPGGRPGCMVYRSSCRRWGMRMFGAVSSYTCVLWGSWQVTVISDVLSLRVMVWGMM